MTSFFSHVFKREPSRLLPADLALILQYGSGLSSDFLAKILSLISLLFFVIHNFIS